MTAEYIRPNRENAFSRGINKLKDFYWHEMKDVIWLGDIVREINYRGSVTIQNTFGEIKSGVIWAAQHPMETIIIVGKTVNESVGEIETGMKSAFNALKHPNRKIASVALNGTAIVSLLAACAPIQNTIPSQVDCNTFNPTPQSKVLATGPNIGPWFLEQAFGNTRRIYNRKNFCAPEVVRNYIPTTTLISDDDLNRTDYIGYELGKMLENGLAPKLRIATHFNDDRWLRPNEGSAELNGRYLAKAINGIDSKIKISIQLGNERNLNLESDGTVDPRADARYDYKFLKSLTQNTVKKFRNWEVALSPQSWGIDSQNGKYPHQYLDEYFTEMERLKMEDESNFEFKFDGVSLNVYQNTVSEMSADIARQIGEINRYAKYMVQNYFVDLTEFGPIDPTSGKAFSNCRTDQQRWSLLISNVIKAIYKNSKILGKNIRYITVACFGSAGVDPAVITEDGAFLYSIMP